jgi:RNase P subunit RPR2
MEVHRQQCQSCQSFETRNLLVRQPNESTIVFVRCGHCGDLVARYRLTDYYHHGKDVESFLRSHGAGAMESGRRVLDEFNRAKEESMTGYEKALEYLREHGKPI